MRIDNKDHDSNYCKIVAVDATMMGEEKKPEKIIKANGIKRKRKEAKKDKAEDKGVKKEKIENPIKPHP